MGLFMLASYHAIFLGLILAIAVGIGVWCFVSSCWEQHGLYCHVKRILKTSQMRTLAHSAVCASTRTNQCVHRLILMLCLFALTSQSLLRRAWRLRNSTKSLLVRTRKYCRLPLYGSSEIL